MYELCFVAKILQTMRSKLANRTLKRKKLLKTKQSKKESDILTTWKKYIKID